MTKPDTKKKKAKNRRHISVRGDTYGAITAHCEAAGESRSALVERLITEGLDRLVGEA